MTRQPRTRPTLEEVVLAATGASPDRVEAVR